MVKALLFDLNGTVIDILTDEWNMEVYRVMANLVSFYGVSLAPEEVRDFFMEHNQRQRRESSEEHPEFDAAVIFDHMLDRYGTEKLPRRKREFLPEFLAEAFRAASRFKMELYPGVRPVLDKLGKRYRMAAVSDGQSLWAVPEMRSLGLGGDFEFVLVSGDYGFRKPDVRMYEMALKKMNLLPEDVIFIGNDMYRDIWGARQAGMRTVFFKSNQGDHKSRGVEADYIIYEFSQLPEAIRHLEHY